MAKLAKTSHRTYFSLSFFWLQRPYFASFNISITFQSKYKRHKIKGTKSPDFDERDEQIFEIMQDFFPNHLQKVDRAVNFDDSDDTAMDDEDSVVHGIEFSDVGEDPIKVVNVKKDGDVTEYGDSDNDETVAPADFDKAPDVAGENVTSAQNNGAFHANTFQNRRMDALKVEMAEMQNYKMKLELMKMERELYLKPSKYTKDIMSRQGLYQRRKITPITKSSASHR